MSETRPSADKRGGEVVRFMARDGERYLKTSEFYGTNKGLWWKGENAASDTIIVRTNPETGLKEILLVNIRGEWALPGGFVNKDIMGNPDCESEAASAEVLEETWLTEADEDGKRGQPIKITEENRVFPERIFTNDPRDTYVIDSVTGKKKRENYITSAVYKYDLDKEMAKGKRFKLLERSELTEEEKRKPEFNESKSGGQWVPLRDINFDRMRAGHGEILRRMHREGELQFELQPRFARIWNPERRNAALAEEHEGQRILPEEGFPTTQFGTMGKWRGETDEALPPEYKSKYNPGIGYNAKIGHHPIREARQAHLAKLNQVFLEGNRPGPIAAFETGMLLAINEAYGGDKKTVLGFEKILFGLGKGKRSERMRAIMSGYVAEINRTKGPNNQISLTPDLSSFKEELARILLSDDRTTFEDKPTRPALIDAVCISGSRALYSYNGKEVSISDPRYSWKQIDAEFMERTAGVKVVDPSNTDSNYRAANGLSELKDEEKDWGNHAFESAAAEIKEKSRFAVVYINIPSGLNRDGEPAGLGALGEIGFQIALASRLGQKIVLKIEIPQDFNMGLNDPYDNKEFIAKYPLPPIFRDKFNEKIDNQDLEITPFVNSGKVYDGYLKFCEQTGRTPEEGGGQSWVDYHKLQITRKPDGTEEISNDWYMNNMWQKIMTEEIQLRYTVLDHLNELRLAKSEFFAQVFESVLVSNDRNQKVQKYPIEQMYLS